MRSHTIWVSCILLGCYSCATEEKPAGHEGGHCYGNNTCNEGLVCLSDLCVRPADAGNSDAAAPPDRGSALVDASVSDHELEARADISAQPIDFAAPDGAPQGHCGDGIRNGAEQCDLNDIPLVASSCQSLSLGTGTVSCTANCTLDLSNCADTTWAVALAGQFNMGSPASEPCRDHRETQHRVTLTRSYLISKTEVTTQQFEAAMGYNPSLYTYGPTYPVNMVNWSEAAAYCNALSTVAGHNTCYSCSGTATNVSCEVAPAYDGTAASIFDCPGYRLPTEAEWEYAYRAGTTDAYYSGPNDPLACTSCSYPDANAVAIAWYCLNAYYVVHPVGQKPANAWGLHDMAGNLEEWVHDWHQHDLGPGPQIDPWGPPGGAYRMTRGGSVEKHLQGPNLLRAASRDTYFDPTEPKRYMFWGFRCVRSL